MILAAVSISAVYNSKIINYATNGAVDYATESVKENEILDKTTSLMESAISNIESINAGNGGTSGSTEEPDEGGDDENPPPVEEPEVGIDFGGMTEEDIENNYVGKYVEYTPISGTFSDHVGETYSGDDANNNEQLSTDTSVKWKILFAEGNTLTLISDKAVHNNFYLQGANGYNNGVLLLNNACKTLYSNNSLGAVGRSLDIEDIERYMTYDKTKYTNYGSEYSPINRNYPVIYEEEKTGAPNGTYGAKYGLSDQNTYKTGTDVGNEYFKGKYTYYTVIMSTTTMKKQIYVELFSSIEDNWLASRCVDFDTNKYCAYFYLFYIIDSAVYANWLYESHGNKADNDSSAIRPVVEIDLTKVNVGLTGTGAHGDGYSLTLK